MGNNIPCKQVRIKQTAQHFRSMNNLLLFLFQNKTRNKYLGALHIVSFLTAKKLTGNCMPCKQPYTHWSFLCLHSIELKHLYCYPPQKQVLYTLCLYFYSRTLNAAQTATYTSTNVTSNNNERSIQRPTWQWEIKQKLNTVDFGFKKWKSKKPNTVFLFFFFAIYKQKNQTMNHTLIRGTGLIIFPSSAV